MKCMPMSHCLGYKALLCPKCHAGHADFDICISFLQLQSCDMYVTLNFFDFIILPLTLLFDGHICIKLFTFGSGSWLGHDSHSNQDWPEKRPSTCI